MFKRASTIDKIVTSKITYRAYNIPIKGLSSKIKTRKTSNSSILENCYPRKFPAIRYIWQLFFSFAIILWSRWWTLNYTLWLKRESHFSIKWAQYVTCDFDLLKIALILWHNVDSPLTGWVLPSPSPCLSLPLPCPSFHLSLPFFLDRYMVHICIIMYPPHQVARVTGAVEGVLRETVLKHKWSQSAFIVSFFFISLLG